MSCLWHGVLEARARKMPGFPGHVSASAQLSARRCPGSDCCWCVHGAWARDCDTLDCSRMAGHTCVVVVNECDGALGIVANDARRLAILVAQAPVLAVLDSLLQNALCGEVEGAGGAACAINPVHHCLPSVVLVVVQLSAIPPGHVLAIAPSPLPLL